MSYRDLHSSLSLPEWLTGTGITAVNLGRIQDFVTACVELIQKRVGVHIWEVVKIYANILYDTDNLLIYSFVLFFNIYQEHLETYFSLPHTHTVIKPVFLLY